MLFTMKYKQICKCGHNVRAHCTGGSYNYDAFKLMPCHACIRLESSCNECDDCKAYEKKDAFEDMIVGLNGLQ